MQELKYEKIWLALVDIRPMEGYNFAQITDAYSDTERDVDVSKYTGAVANVLLKADDIYQAIDIIKPGLAELKFESVFIEKVENVAPLVDNGDLNEAILGEIEWLLESNYVFKISDKLFPYSE